MKKFLFLVCFAGLGLASHAQKTSFGFKGGLNLSTVATEDDEFNEDRVMRPAIHAGAVLDVAVSPAFSIQPQLLIQGKGVSQEHGGHKDKFKFTSLDIPVNLLYRRGGFFIGGGPNIGFNLSGKLEAEDNPSENTEFTFGDDGQFNRANFALNAMTGYQTSSGIFISVNYLRGLSDWKDGANDKWKNHLLGFSIGYMLGAKK